MTVFVIDENNGFITIRIRGRSMKITREEARNLWELLNPDWKPPGEWHEI